MQNTYDANEKEFQEKYFELVAAIKESNKHCSKEESRFNQLLLALADEVMRDKKMSEMEHESN